MNRKQISWSSILAQMHVAAAATFEYKSASQFKWSIKFRMTNSHSRRNYILVATGKHHVPLQFPQVSTLATWQYKSRSVEPGLPLGKCFSSSIFHIRLGRLFQQTLYITLNVAGRIILHPKIIQQPTIPKLSRPTVRGVLAYDIWLYDLILSSIMVQIPQFFCTTNLRRKRVALIQDKPQKLNIQII